MECQTNYVENLSAELARMAMRITQAAAAIIAAGLPHRVPTLSSKLNLRCTNHL